MTPDLNLDPELFQLKTDVALSVVLLMLCKTCWVQISGYDLFTCQTQTKTLFGFSQMDHHLFFLFFWTQLALLLPCFRRALLSKSSKCWIVSISIDPRAGVGGVGVHPSQLVVLTTVLTVGVDPSSLWFTIHAHRAHQYWTAVWPYKDETSDDLVCFQSYCVPINLWVTSWLCVVTKVLKRLYITRVWVSVTLWAALQSVFIGNGCHWLIAHHNSNTNKREFCHKTWHMQIITPSLYETSGRTCILT